jgi:signal transduction histidine kinase
VTRRRNELAWAAAVLALALAAIGMAEWAGGDRQGGDWTWTLVLTVVYASAGVPLATRAPRLGGIFLVIALSSSLALLSGQHADAVADGRLDQLGGLAVWVSSWSWVPSYVLIAAVLPALLPDGRPLGGRWRWAHRVGLAAAAVGVLGWAVVPYDELDEPSDAALALGVQNPVGIPGTAPLLLLGLLLTGVAATWGLVSLVVRWRRAERLDRPRLAWVIGGVLATAALFALGQTVPGGSSLVLALAVLPLPASVLGAVLRHGLWDPELALRRSLVWLLLSAVVAVAFVAVVAVLGNVLGARVGAPLVAAAFVALGIAPVRDRLQAAVSRLIYGEGADPYDAVSRLSARLAAVATPREALAEAAAGVAQALRLPAVRIVVADGPTTSYGHCATLESQAHRLELVHAGEIVGVLVAEPRKPGVPLRTADLRLLASLSREAGATAHAARLQAQLERSRARLAVAQEEARRRLRHDLHDSLGPALAGVALQLESLPALVERDPEAAAAVADRLTGRVQDAVAQVRRLVEGLGSSSDLGLGLVEALRAQVEGFDAPALRSELLADEAALGELPAAVETVTVRVVGEALANAARHARADACQVRVDRSADGLVVVVRDNGMGVTASRTAATTRGSGVGLTSMALVAEEIGGTCTVFDAPGGGTEVRLMLPLPS